MILKWTFLRICVPLLHCSFSTVLFTMLRKISMLLWHPNWTVFSLFLFPLYLVFNIQICLFSLLLFQEIGLHLFDKWEGIYLWQKYGIIYNALIDLSCCYPQMCFPCRTFFCVKEMNSWNSDNPKLNLNQAHKSKYKTNSEMWSEFAYVSFVCKIKFWQEMENKKIIFKRMLIWVFLSFFIWSSLRIDTTHQDDASYAGNFRDRK